MRAQTQTQIAEYFSEKPELSAVYLFGSCAVGKELKGSDVDLGILFIPTDQNSMLQMKDQYLVELSRILRKDLHLVVMNSANQELLRQIFSKGISIVVNDPKELARFRMVQFSRIADYGYYRQQMQRGLIRRLMGGSEID